MDRQFRHNRIRYKIKGTAERPRLSVYRSLIGLWVQLIDDQQKKTLLAGSHKQLKKYSNKIDQAKQLGKFIAQAAQGKNIKQIVFDRGGYKYHGRIKALAEGLRDGGLNF